MENKTVQMDLPSRRFTPRIYDVGAWTPHLHFGYDLVATLKPRLLVELGVDRGESYFTFCQSVAENKTGTRCFGIDTWSGDQHAGGYDETTFAQVSTHNRANYEPFSTLIRSRFDDALDKFDPGSLDLLHIDGLHTEGAVRHDVDSWLPKVRPGGIVLLHDVDVRQRNFGVWKIWDELQGRGRSWTFHDGPGLGVWQKPPETELPGFLEPLMLPNASHDAMVQYYRERSAELQRQIGEEWRNGTIRHTPFAQQTVIQVFHTNDGTHREEDSLFSRIGHSDWKDVTIELPEEAGAAPLRIDFVSALTTIDVAWIRLTRAGVTCFATPHPSDFDSIRLGGDVERLDHPTALRLKITGVDPQLYLPVVALPTTNGPLVLEMRLQVRADH